MMIALLQLPSPVRVTVKVRVEDVPVGISQVDVPTAVISLPPSSNLARLVNGFVARMRIVSFRGSVMLAVCAPPL